MAAWGTGGWACSAFLCGMIVVTGAAGFIGSALVGHLLAEGWQDIVAVDDFSRLDKAPNLDGKQLTARVERSAFFDWLDANEGLVQFIFHLGARTDTTEFDRAIFDELNVRYSQRMWKACVKYGIPLVYASSAATYGDGDLGYDDADDALPYALKPLNPYGESKNDFDKWALEQARKPYFWAGLKFFNVYGPNEYHKGRMASVAFHQFNQFRAEGKVKLFGDYGGYAAGEQQRDFVFVDDVVAVNLWFFDHPRQSGLFNLGSGRAQPFNDVALATVNAMRAAQGAPAVDLPAAVAQGLIEYVPFPDALRGKYQCYTQADLTALRAAGCDLAFADVASGVASYMKVLMNS